MNKNWIFLSLAMLIPFALRGEVEEETYPVSKRHRLEVINATNDNEDEGRDLHLEWNGDVYDAPRVTERLHPGQKDWFLSKGIGDGDNVKVIEVNVSRYKEETLSSIGRFVHELKAPPLANGHTEEVTVFLKNEENSVEVWREWYDPITKELKEDYIGCIKKESW